MCTKLGVQAYLENNACVEEKKEEIRQNLSRKPSRCHRNKGVINGYMCLSVL